MPRLVLLPQRLGPAPLPTPRDLPVWRHRTHGLSRRPDMRGRFVRPGNLPGRPILRRRQRHHMPSRLLLHPRLVPTSSLQRNHRLPLPTRRQRAHTLPHKFLLPLARVQRLVRPEILLSAGLDHAARLCTRVLLREHVDSGPMRQRHAVLNRHHSPAALPRQLLLPRPRHRPRLPARPALRGEQHGTRGMRGQFFLPNAIDPNPVPTPNHISPKRQLLPQLHVPARDLRHRLRRHARQVCPVPAGRRLPGQRGKEDVRLLMNAYLK